MKESIKDKIFKEQLEGIRGMCKAVFEGAYPNATPEFEVCILLNNALDAYWLHKSLEVAK